MKYVTVPILTIVAIVLAFLLLRTCGEPAPAIPPELKARADSLEATKAERDQARDSIAHLADSVEALGNALRRRAAPQRDTAVARGITADSAASLARQAETARDSAVAWETAYMARSQQAVELQGVVAKLDSAAVADSLAIGALRAGWNADRTRLVVAEQLVKDLVDAAEKKHRWRWLERIGVSAGYGVQASADGRFSHGLQVTAGVKIYR